MANRTDTDARAIHGANPQLLMEKITRLKIYDSMYWKEKCFALNSETLVDEVSVDIYAFSPPYCVVSPLLLSLKLLARKRLPRVADAVLPVV